ncbi:AsmA family protein [Adhaeribacter sp. BT258]|uniref:AsmA family protein n=1 Tax=Adhaeribacter terrigena TaxID=2793070 RepID=A0ABS1C4X9_9BACT|nr:AsmA-like C-terminal region-containing protein [Adhaeribacter terrigena]MBK0403595.1 AsmA family protein [Adhaeribacter terrigena]
MKKVFIGFAIFLVILLAAAALVPVLFKDKIKEVVDREIAKNVEAKVIYNADDIGVSIFSTFPNLGLNIDNLAVVGVDSFQRDTLAYLPQFRMGLDLMSVISGDQLKIKSIKLTQPNIKLKVLKSGKANWDIYKAVPTEGEPDTVQSDFSMAMEKWEVENGKLVYEDLSIPFSVQLLKMNHTGSGDFEKSVFDMVSKTTSEGFTMTYDGVNYITNKKLDADVTLAMDLDKSLYTFKDNKFKINDFAMDFAGTILMPKEDIDLDLTFKALDTDFKTILSLVPGMYTEQFKDVKTEGKLAFNGYVKGRFNETSMPGFGTDLKVTNAMFKYPDLPQAATNINVDMSVDNKDGIINNTNVEVRKFHLDLGKNPVDAKAVINGLDPMKVDGNLKASIDLNEITKVFPVEGMTLRGLLKVDANAKGTYSAKQMPVMTANLNLANGYVKSKDFPAPIENLSALVNVLNATGNTDDTEIKIENFKMLLEGEPLAGRVYVKGIDKPIFDADVKGTIDLTKMTKIFPLEGMTLTGRIKADIKTKGKMADIEAGKYANITSSGSMNVDKLTFVSTDLPQGMKVTTANASFNNEKINVQNMSGFVGKSDVQMNGVISNYMGYMFAENQPLRGTMNVSSNRFNVNEWMVDEYSGQPVAQQTPTEATGVVEVPGNIDFVLNATVKEVLYDNLNLQNMKGAVIIKDKTAKLQNLAFNTLGGSFVTNGSYNTQSLSQPKFTFDLDIKNLEFKEAFNAFETIQKLAPISKFLEGKFSTNFAFAGELGQDMMPVMGTMSGKGVIEVVRAVVKNIKVLNKIGETTNFKEVQNFIIENKDIAAEILNGNLVVKPFDVKVGDINMLVGGTNNLSGGIDYGVALDVPTGKVGSALNNKLSSFAGMKDYKGAERVTLNLKVGGTMDDPKVALAGGSAKAQAKDMVKDVVASRLNTEKEKLNVKRQAAQDSLQRELDRRKKEAEDKARQEMEKKRQEAEDKLKKEAENKLKGIFKR